jgi:signal transduction histidine kinase
MVFSCFAYSQNKSIKQLKMEIKELKNVSDFMPENKHYVNLLLELTHWLKYSQTDTIKIIALETLELSKKLNYEKGKFESILNFGFYYLLNVNPDQAIYYYKKNLDTSFSIRFPNLAIEAYNGIAQAYFIKADYPSSYINFLKSLEIAEKANDLAMIIKMNTNIGTMFSLLQDYDEALIYYNTAQTKFNNLTTALTKVQVLVNLGYLHAKKQENDKALDYLSKSISILKNEEAKRMLAFGYNTTGEVYNQLFEYEKALSFFDKANLVYETIKDKKGEADLYYSYGIAYFNLNDIKKAENYFTQSLELYTSFSLKTGMEKCYKALYNLNKKKGFNGESLNYLELTQQYGDSVEKENQRRDISMLKAKMSFEKTKAQITEQNKININNQKKNAQWTTACLIVAILITLFVFRINTTKRRLNKELASQAAILSKKEKELSKINNNQDKLFSIVGHDLRDSILSIKQSMSSALEKDTGIQYFYTFGPKLKNDVDDIHFTLDNLLSWGLTQTIGDVSKPVSIFVKENLLESERFFREALDKKNITVKNHVPDNLTLTVDSNDFTIIFRNLLSNAIKFTPETSQISIDSYTENNTTTISIKDTGKGIPKEIMGKIFNNTSHYTSFGTNNERGTGLGLILCKELVKKNKGSISIQSKLKQGSIFSVHFVADKIEI